MKKQALFFAFIPIVAFLFCFSGCANQPEAENENENIGLMMDEITVFRDVYYVTFEEAITESTSVIVAEYEGYNESSCKGKVFKVIEQLKGNTSEERICIHDETAYVTVLDIGLYYISNQEYVIGEKYVLVASRNVSVYNEHDVYLTTSDIYIPIKDVSCSRIYGKEMLGEHSKLLIGENTKAEDVFLYIQSVLELSKTETPDYWGQDFTHSTDFYDVIGEAEYISKVLIGEAQAKTTKETIIYECTVIEQYKGSISDKTVEIMFLEGDVNQGEEYILATNSTAIDGFMHLSSKASIFGVELEESIVDFLSK